MIINDFLQRTKKMTSFSSDEALMYDAFFWSVDFEKSQREVRIFLSDFFKSKASAVSLYYFTYWRWYSTLNWRCFSSYGNFDSISDGLSTQLPMAIRLGYNPIFEICNYFYLNFPMKYDMANTFFRLKTIFLGSDWPMCVVHSDKMSLAQIIKEHLTLDANGNSLKKAEFFSELQAALFGERDNLFHSYSVENREIAFADFLAVIDLFVLIESDTIFDFVNNFFSNGKNFSQPSTQMSFKVITDEDLKRFKSLILSEFPHTPDGQFDNIEAVLARLGELGEEYGDPGIAEMLYWDEEKGRFEWRDV